MHVNASICILRKSQNLTILFDKNNAHCFTWQHWHKPFLQDRDFELDFCGLPKLLLFTFDTNNKWINCIWVLTAEVSALASNMRRGGCRLNAATVGRFSSFLTRQHPLVTARKWSRHARPARDRICLLSNYATSKHWWEQKLTLEEKGASSTFSFCISLEFVTRKMFKRHSRISSGRWWGYKLLW